MEKEQLEALAAQLGNPSGEKGIEVAEMMNETNIGMTKNSISNLRLRDGDSVLELGHGNAGHLNFLFSQSNDIQYTGLEISSLMHEEAKQSNHAYAAAGKARFVLYDGEKMPLEDHAVDKAFTVNTIYFWKDPEKVFAELSRILKPDGMLALTFAHRSFMEMLPFTVFGFTLYNPDEILKIISETNFQPDHQDEQREVVKTKTGESVERFFSTLVLKNNL
ncbi:methyltransferase domain-containing protein [Fluviicola sp.]|uniref:class I SAM-dependent methyltransferase n=1 Tax=Fluviicola sp. TaxID=1917219 RepID=UPI0026283670|nr:methyltransferase domain-containing protein [Fluviicola sp.]